MPFTFVSLVTHNGFMYALTTNGIVFRMRHDPYTGQLLVEEAVKIQ